MNYFICELDIIYLGVPAEQIRRIIPVTRFQTNVLETENEEAFISVPALFHPKAECTQDNAVHGLILKNGLTACDFSGKTILLAPKIDIDMEIPEEKIFRLPEAFTGVFSFLRGAHFTDDYKMILILDTEKLTANIKPEKTK